LLRLAHAIEESELGGGALRENFAELPQLEKADAGISREMSLRLRR
jgi:hypothetical protein